MKTNITTVLIWLIEQYYAVRRSWRRCCRHTFVIWASRLMTASPRLVRKWLSSPVCPSPCELLSSAVNHWQGPHLRLTYQHDVKTPSWTRNFMKSYCLIIIISFRPFIRVGMNLLSYKYTMNKFIWFLPARRYASAGYSDRNVSICLSVRLSRASIVSKRRKLAAWFLHHLIAPRL